MQDICITQTYIMKKNIYKVITLYTLALITTFCTTKKTSVAQVVITDPVCGNKVIESESYDWKYAGKKYSFDSYDCRKAFQMNPQEFIMKKCTPDDISVDPVCGMKVNMSESYDLTYKGKKYYFDSYECKETFKMNPPKFLDNKCAAADAGKLK